MGKTTSRREFLRNSGAAAAASVLTAAAVPHVHAAGGGTIQVALIGCGGRGTGAADNALSVKGAPMKLVAMADVFEARLAKSYEFLSKAFEKQIDVPEERRFLGFDAYRKAIDCLKPGDVAIFATPPAFRWVHFTYAIEKGVNVFMEKPVTVDGPTSRRMFELAKKADEKNLKVGVGLMVRHCRGRRELHDRIRSGQIGEIISMRGYRMQGPSCMARPKPDGISELMYQVQKFHAFLWGSGGAYSDLYIHQIDECSWMKGAWPVKAHAIGGRQRRGVSIDQNFDNYGVEYVFPDGTRLHFHGRAMRGCRTEFASYAHGAWGSAVISTSAHYPGKVRVYKGHNMTQEELLWAHPQPELNPYYLEWEDLVEAIVNDRPYNEVERGVQASLVTSMGRMSAHTGQEITYEQILNSDHEFAPGLDELTADSPAPLQKDADGNYPWPDPGLKKLREY